jgi:tetratricopeptide (TPR) repeat protein
VLEAFYGLLTIEESQSNNDARLELALQALEVFPLDMQLLCAMGGYLQHAGRWDLALRSYETAFRFGQIQPEVWHMDQLRAVAAECFVLSLQLRGRGAEALEVLEEALAAEPKSQRLIRQLLDAYIKQGRRDESLKLSERVYLADGAREAFRSAIRGACLAAKQNWISARAYLQVAHQAGCRDTICLRWLSTTLLASGEHAAARSILVEWAAKEPENVEPQRYLQAIDSGQLSGQQAEPPGDRQIRVDSSSPDPAPDAAATRTGGAAHNRR